MTPSLKMTSNNNLLERWLSENKIKFLKDFNIKYKSWLKAGGIVKNFITPNNDLIMFPKSYKRYLKSTQKPDFELGQEFLDLVSGLYS